MTLSPAYVLSTRSLSTAVVEAAAAKGVMIDALSFIAVELFEAPELPAEPLTAIFTSANAVASLEKGIGQNWKIFCLGHATRRKVAECFGESAIAGMADSAKQLAMEIIRQMPTGETSGADSEVWFFCGDRRRDELPDLLKQAGISVHEVVVYRTRLTPHRIVRKYDAIAFWSPSAVESFFFVNTLSPDIPLFAIGGTTAEAIRKKCDNPLTVSERPDEELLIQLIIKKIQH